MLNRRNVSLLVLLLIAGLVAGCSDSDTGLTESSLTASDDYDKIDFSLPYGGLTVSDEEEAFGDESLQAMLYAEDDELVNDPLLDDPEIQDLEDQGNRPHDPDGHGRPRFTYVKLAWGMIHGPDDTTRIDGPCDPLDWTGEIHTDRGIVIVRRTLPIQTREDHVIFPRLNRQTVAFTSRTGCHFDGLLLQIIEPPANPGDPEADGAEPNRLHINTGPYSGVYQVNELSEINDLIDVDELGNRFLIKGFSVSDIGVCPKGFLSGRYRLAPPPEEDADADGGQEQGQRIGKYAGAWTTLDGRIHGFLRGGYGLNAEGERVFIGKFIGRRGAFRGLIRGAWEPGETDVDLASFEAHWVSASGNREGLLGGDAHPVEDYPGGFFVGRWTTLCDEEAEAEIR